MKPYQILTILFIIGVSTTTVASVIPARPVPPRLVNDMAGVLDQQAVIDLETRLVNFANHTSTQVAIVTINDLGGHAAGDFAFRLAESWGIGQKGSDNGVLILVKPRVGEERGEAFIATGYGLEGVLPDAVVNRIVDNEMIPHFRSGNYHGGLLAATTIIMNLTQGEFSANDYLGHTRNKESAAGTFIALAMFILFFIITTKARRTRNSSIGHNIPFWVLMSMLGSTSRRHNSHWGNFSSGRGSFGGGFGGFGGGSFGGGGAGGSW